MTDEPSPLDYNATLNRMEPGIAPMDPQIALASIAITLRDISNSMRLIAAELYQIKSDNLRTHSEIRDAIASGFQAVQASAAMPSYAIDRAVQELKK